MDAKNYIPHRPPFLFVDDVETDATGKHITGNRTFREDDFFFAGHFPGAPVVPGVILTEALAQCGGAGLFIAFDCPGEYQFVLAAVKDVKLRHPVFPGDTLQMEVKTIRRTSKLIRQKGVGRVGGNVAIEADWICFIKKTGLEKENK